MDFQLGDQVRVDIPDESDPDFEFHGDHGIIIDIVEKMCECGYGKMYCVVLADRDLTLELHPWDVRAPFTPVGPTSQLQKR